ncbi:MAG: hypothetical protein JXQ90_22905 [Cyclobacteriaceae bacterium]
MKKLFLIIVGLIALNGSSIAQESVSVGRTLDQLTFTWDNEAISLSTYEGLRKFCQDETYRVDVIQLLNEIHHYDSILYQRALVAKTKSSDREIVKLIHEIESFEEEYSSKKFIHFLHQECNAQKSLEKDSDNLKRDIGQDSYDSQVYLIEVEIQRYVKHVTKRVDSIKKHINHLHVK